MQQMIEAAMALQGALATIGVLTPLRIVIAYDDIPPFIARLQREGVNISFGQAKRAAILRDGFYDEVFYGVVFALDFTQFERIRPPVAFCKARPVSPDMRL